MQRDVWAVGGSVRDLVVDEGVSRWKIERKRRQGKCYACVYDIPECSCL